MHSYQQQQQQQQGMLLLSTSAQQQSEQQPEHLLGLQQLQLLLLQEQAILHQLQDQALHGASTNASSSSSSSAAVGSSAAKHVGLAAACKQQPGGTTGVVAFAAAGAESPADWFVCDGPTDHHPASGLAPVRYIVIQGSITLDHWRINLKIDPCEFEGGALGRVKVHRGVYQAALLMYDQFVPLVEEHLARDPEAQVAFTGHSLGGSLATLLMLLLVHR
jgi:hypothetical protein